MKKRYPRVTIGAQGKGWFVQAGGGISGGKM